MSEKKFYEKYGAWKNHAMHGNCYKLCQSMDEMVKDLMGKRIENEEQEKRQKRA